MSFAVRMAAVLVAGLSFAGHAVAQDYGPYDLDGTNSIDALLLGKGGVSLGDALVYAAGGTGIVSGGFGYALGGGAEYGFTDYMSVRGEVLGTGSWGSMPSDMRLTAGLAFHL